MILSPYQSATDQVSFLGYSFIFMLLWKWKQQALCSVELEILGFAEAPERAPPAPLMKCCLEAFTVALTKEMIFFLSHQWLHTRLWTIWQKHTTVSPCPQITWHPPGATCWLGAGYYVSQMKGTRKTVPFLAPSQSTGTLQTKDCAKFFWWFFHF